MGMCETPTKRWRRGNLFAAWKGSYACDGRRGSFSPRKSTRFEARLTGAVLKKLDAICVRLPVERLALGKLSALCA
jgi:hypothetical protein